MGFEVFAESELFGEAELGSDVFDLRVGLAQQVLGLVDSDHVDPLHRCVTRFLLDDVRKMTRRQTLLLGIVLHRPMLAVLRIERQQKGHHDLALVGKLLRLLQQLSAEQLGIFQ